MELIQAARCSEDLSSRIFITRSSLPKEFSEIRIIEVVRFSAGALLDAVCRDRTTIVVATQNFENAIWERVFKHRFRSWWFELRISRSRADNLAVMIIHEEMLLRQIAEQIVDVKPR